MSGWSIADIPDQTGRTVLVTGANSGIGFEAAKALAHRGAHVVLACRNQAKAVEAQRSIEASGKASVEILPLDLSSLAQVREAAGKFRAKHSRLDLLVNNAGVMWLPRTLSADGQEMQFATNHLGHYALTGHLLDLVLGTPGARIVTVSSIAHAQGRIRFDDPSYANSHYSRLLSYGQSKVANLIFAYELARRLEARGVKTASIACHPGVSATNLGVPGFQNIKVMAFMSDLMMKVVGQSPAAGALPTLYAATSPEARNGDYIGPDGFRQMRGAPRKVGSTRYSRDEDVARRLWELSEKITGVKYL